MKKFAYILLGALALITTSCGSSKRVADAPVVETPSMDMEKNMYEATLEKAYDFKLMQSKAKYTLGDKSLSGRLNIERGKRLCMTVTVLGIEVARMEADQKKVVIVDKFDKLYTELSIEEFAARLGMQDEMRYEALECILLGRMFVPGEGEADAKDFKKLEWNIDNGVLYGNMNKPKYQLSYRIGDDNRLAETNVKVKGGAAEIACKYAGYESIEGGEFATAETLSVASADMNVSASLSLSAPTMGKAFTSFTPNAQYKQVDIKTLVTAIKNLKN